MATIDNRFPTEGTQIDMEARLAAIETALASLMNNTTGQSIASAITALAGSISPTADNVSFDNTGTDLTSSDVEGAIKELDTVTTTTTGTNGGNIRKYGHVVSVNFQGVVGDSIGSIPVGFRPQAAAERTIIYVEKYNGTTLINSYYALLAIENNGNISCAYMPTFGSSGLATAKNANHKIYGNITYVV